MPARTLAAIALASALVAAAWLRVESAGPEVRDLAPILALALVPAGAGLLRRHWAFTALAAAASTLVAASVVFDVPLTDIRPGERDFFGPVFDRFHQGFLDFYETLLPFDRADFALMHEVVLFAVFGFVALVAVLLALRRPVGAGVTLLGGAGWPTTLSPGSHPLALGAVGLAAVLAVLFLARSGPRASRGLVPAAAACAALVAIAVGASTTNAVAKREFVVWQRWDLYDRPQDPVGVRYVWSSHYQGIRFPKKETVVLRVKVSGAKSDRLYWRATTLDEYTGVAWRESLRLDPPATAERIDFTDDPLLPKAALDEKSWVKQEITVGALSDDHLIASAQPVKLRTGTAAPVRRAESGVVVLPSALRIGQRYTAWSYVPDADIVALAKVKSAYPQSLGRDLELVPGLRLPAWGVEGRDAQMEKLFDDNAQNFYVISYQPIYRKAREVVGEAKSPYAAALALEDWLRRQGGFEYDERPGAATTAEPPLVAFLLRSKRGYCQHFAGSMAVMLRLLGVPARVAAGFTSGKYDERKKEWVVTDHNAHAWVEVYFPGYGWLPFDPTPGRGELGASYSSTSPTFARGDIGGRAALLLGRSAVLDALTAEALRSAARRPGPEGTGPGPAGGRAGQYVAKAHERSLAALAFLVVGAALGALLAVKLLRRELRFATRDPRALATACRRDLVAFLADQRVPVASSATLAEVGAVLEREFVVEAGHFVRHASAARFGPPGEADVAARKARRELRLLRRQMRRELGLAGRVRGALSVRSLTV